MSTPRVFVFGDTISASTERYAGESTTWSPLNVQGGDSLDINFDSKRKTVIYEDVVAEKAIEKRLDNLENTEFSMKNVKDIVSIQIDSLTGDVYALSKSVVTPIKHSLFWSGTLYRQKRMAKSPSVINLSYLAEVVPLFYPQDMKIDSSKRRLWIADTGNHRLLSIDMNSLEVVSIFRPENLFLCCGLSINPSNGVLISRWFDPSSFIEKIVVIENDKIVSTYNSFSTFPWGSFSETSGKGDLLVLESKGKRKGLYRILENGMGKSLVSNSYPKTPVKIAVEPMNGMVSVLHNDGTLLGHSKELELINTFKYTPDARSNIFPSSYGMSCWVGNFDNSINAYSPIMTRPILKGREVLCEASPITELENGVCNWTDLQPTFLAKQGYQLITISKDGNEIIKESRLQTSCDLIVQDLSNGDLFLGKKGTFEITRYDKNHNLVSSLQFPQQITSFDSKHSGDGSVWVSCSTGDVLGAKLDEAPAITSTYSTLESKELKFTKHDLSTGGVWVGTSSRVFKILPGGTELSFSLKGFSHITDIAPHNYLIDLYFNNDVRFNSTKSMAFDGVRNKAWWLSNPFSQCVAMLDFNEQNPEIKTFTIESL